MGNPFIVTIIQFCSFLLVLFISEQNFTKLSKSYAPLISFRNDRRALCLSLLAWSALFASAPQSWVVHLMTQQKERERTQTFLS